MVVPGLTVAEAQGTRPGGESPLAAELARQAREGVREMAQRPGEGLRRVAGVLRIGAAQGRASDTDTAVRRLIQREIRREGRDSLLTRPVDPVRLAEDLKPYGVAYPTPAPPDVEARSQVLDAVVGAGFTEFLLRLATALEDQGNALDRNPRARPLQAQPAFGGNDRAVHPAQFTVAPAQWWGYEWWEICPILKNQRSHLEFLISIMCTVAMIATDPAVAATCVFLSSALASTIAQMYFYGC
jgi:hypothetical protein